MCPRSRHAQPPRAAACCWGSCIPAYRPPTLACSFFCASLTLAVDILKLSPTVAGVTFLAVGNAACDVIASIAAFSTGVPKVGVGTTLGAGIFVTTAVIAVVSFVADVRLARRSFVRDVMFFIITIVYLLLVSKDGSINIYEAVGFVIIYIIFLAVRGGRAGQVARARARAYTHPRTCAYTHPHHCPLQVVMSGRFIRAMRAEEEAAGETGTSIGGATGTEGATKRVSNEIANRAGVPPELEAGFNAEDSLVADSVQATMAVVNRERSISDMRGMRSAADAALAWGVTPSIREDRFDSSGATASAAPRAVLGGAGAAAGAAAGRSALDIARTAALERARERELRLLKANSKIFDTSPMVHGDDEDDDLDDDEVDEERTCAHGKAATAARTATSRVVRHVCVRCMTRSVVFMPDCVCRVPRAARCVQMRRVMRRKRNMMATWATAR
ncbi:hypothetical protein EON68_02980, partial [archaeon]